MITHFLESLAAATDEKKWNEILVLPFSSQILTKKAKSAYDAAHASRNISFRPFEHLNFSFGESPLIATQVEDDIRKVVHSD